MGSISVEEFLNRTQNYPHEVEHLEVLSGRFSRVFLAGDSAYKLKLPVHAAHLLDEINTRTLEARQYCCQEECRIHRELAPHIYRGVSYIREREGRWFLDVSGEEPGQIIEPLVRMRRFSRDSTLEQLLLRGQADQSRIEELLDLLLPFYEGAERSFDPEGPGSPSARGAEIRFLFQDLEGLPPAIVSRVRAEAIRSSLLLYLTLQDSLFRERTELGWVRDVHGDLCTRHVLFGPEGCQVVGRPEYGRLSRIQDVLSDLALLAMEIAFMGQRYWASLLQQRSLERLQTWPARSLLDFYLATHAFLRGKRTLLDLEGPGLAVGTRDTLKQRARRYFILSGIHAGRLQDPVLLLIGGLPGSGRTRLGEMLGRHLGTIFLNTESLSRELLDPLELQESRNILEKILSPEYEETSHSLLLNRAHELLEQGASVVVAGSFLRESHRARFKSMARSVGARVLHLECQAPRSLVLERLRQGQDLGVEIPETGSQVWKLLRRNYEPCPPGEEITLDTSGLDSTLLEECLGILRKMLR